MTETELERMRCAKIIIKMIQYYEKHQYVHVVGVLKAARRKILTGRDGGPSKGRRAKPSDNSTENSATQ